MNDLQTTNTEWWLLQGGFFAQAGRMYSGPYSTKDDAFTARRTLEALSGHNDLFVDQRLVVNNALIDTTEIVREAKADAWADGWAAYDAWIEVDGLEPPLNPYRVTASMDRSTE